MSALESIRKHPGLVMGILGAAIILFILSIAPDILRTFSSKTVDEDRSVAVVDGQGISYQEYDFERNRYMEGIRRNSNVSLTTAQTYGIYNGILEQMIMERVMNKEYEAIGMTVTDNELDDQFLTDEPTEWLATNFRDGSGNYNQDYLKGYVSRLSESEWQEFRETVRDRHLESKFNNLLKASYFVPVKLAEKYYNNKNEKASADIVALRYANIPNSEVEITDQDNKKFYQENKYKFETNETRDIEYVIFDIKPSVADDDEAREYVAGLKEEFEETEDVMAFVNANYDTSYDTTWLLRSEVPAVVEDVLFASETQPGFVYGPYFDNNAYNLVRLVDRQVVDDSLKVRVAFVTREVDASSDTYNAVSSMANDFIAKSKNQASFDATVESMGLHKLVEQGMEIGSYQIPGLENGRQLVRWAFDKKTKVGDVSPLYEFNDMFVVAILTDAIPEGYAPMEKILDRYQNQIINMKKGDIAVSKMQACGTDYGRMVNELKAESTSVSNVSMDERGVGNFGVEAEIVGVIMGMKEGEEVGPIAGNTSAFIIKNVKHTPAAVTNDYSEIYRQKKTYFNGKVNDGTAYTSLKNKANIKDNRLRFF